MYCLVTAVTHAWAAKFRNPLAQAEVFIVSMLCGYFSFV